MKQLRRYRVPLAVICLAGTGPLLRLHFIHTPSAPIGVWRAHAGATPRVGDVVTFCMKPVQARQTRGRPYAGGAAGGPCPFDTWALAKPVIAGPGDTVVHSWGTVSVNGRAVPRSSTRRQDSHGLPLPTAPIGLRVLGPSEYWTYSPYADGSFDSRYVGVIDKEQIRGTLRPVVTWLTRSQLRALTARGVHASRCGLAACALQSNPFDFSLRR
jgi:conjugative transfer signal peptidase TraF